MVRAQGKLRAKSVKVQAKPLKRRDKARVKVPDRPVRKRSKMPNRQFMRPVSKRDKPFARPAKMSVKLSKSPGSVLDKRRSKAAKTLDRL